MVKRNSTSIVVIICFFGDLPWYTQYFLHSCGFENSSISFLIFSDNEYILEKPDNVTFIKFTLGQFQQLASDKLGFSINADYAYKICDFKPAYGIIFSQYIEDFQFWAQSDLDVIYGDLRSFFSDEVLDSYDFLSLRHDYATGCFTLHRNNSYVNNLFRLSEDYKLVFTSSEHYCFDECNFVHPMIADGTSILDVQSEIVSFTHVVKREQKSGNIRAFFDFLLVEGVPGELQYLKGKIFYKDRFEAVMYHLIKFKAVYKSQKIDIQIPDSYRISTTEILL